MKKIFALLLVVGMFVLNGCTSVSIIARDHLFGYVESKDFIEDEYSIGTYDFSQHVFGGFSNYGYADDEHLELRYLKDQVYTEVQYFYDYSEDASGQIDLTLNRVEIVYMNIDENEYLKLVKDGLNDNYQMTEEEYDDFIVMLYELRMKDVIWVITSLGYELK
jgi:hypothetical protein